MTAEAAPASAPTAAATIVVDGVSKWFGSVVAVNDVSFEVTPGVTGLLGPNGAGKTTLLHLMAGLAAPSEGDVTVLGERVRGNPAIYARMGVMTEQEAVYGFLTGRQFVELNARLQGVDDVAAAVDRAIALVDLEHPQHRTIGGYSRGMRQRMRLAAALVHDPTVLLLDEPLSGTDPRQRLHFQDVVRQLAREGRTILISSHILEEVEVLADRIVLLVAGKVAATGDYRAIRRKLILEIAGRMPEKGAPEKGVPERRGPEGRARLIPAPTPVSHSGPMPRPMPCDLGESIRDSRGSF